MHGEKVCGKVRDGEGRGVLLAQKRVNSLETGKHLLKKKSWLGMGGGESLEREGKRKVIFFPRVLGAAGGVCLKKRNVAQTVRKKGLRGEAAVFCMGGKKKTARSSLSEKKGLFRGKGGR